MLIISSLWGISQNCYLEHSGGETEALYLEDLSSGPQIDSGISKVYCWSPDCQTTIPSTRLLLPLHFSKKPLTFIFHLSHWKQQKYIYALPWVCIVAHNSLHVVWHQFNSVHLLSHVRLFATPWSQHTRPPCPSPTPRVHSDSRPSSPWCHPAISSSVVPFSSCPQSLPASESLQMKKIWIRVR